MCCRCGRLPVVGTLFFGIVLFLHLRGILELPLAWELQSLFADLDIAPVPSGHSMVLDTRVFAGVLSFPHTSLGAVTRWVDRSIRKFAMVGDHFDANVHTGIGIRATIGPRIELDSDVEMAARTGSHSAVKV